MKKLIGIYAICLFLSTSVSAQEKMTIDYDKIAAEAADSTRYFNLLNRFVKMDITITKEEVALLYYGFPQQSVYLGAPTYELLGMRITRMLEKGQNEEALEAAKSLLGVHPLSLQSLDQIIQALANLRQPLKERAPYWFMIMKILSAIQASGDGKTRETAFKVLTISDEYRVMRYMLDKIPSTGRRSVSDEKKEHIRYDVFQVVPNDMFDTTELWFDKFLYYEPARMNLGNGEQN